MPTQTQFFRVDGADQESGEETYLVLQAATKPQAEKLARQQGLLISSVRVAKPDDWASTPEESEELPDIETTQYIEPGVYVTPGPQAPPPPELAEPAYPAEPEQFIDPAPAAPEAVPPTVAPAEASMQWQPAAEPAGGSSAAAVVLACAGAALVIGGVLALALALWPDNAVRNELQQIDFRLHELSQTVLGGMLVLGGLVVFAMAVVCYTAPRHPRTR